MTGLSMDLFLSESELLLRESARRFLDDAVDHARLAAWERSQTGFAPELWKGITDLGWPRIAVPEPLGGQGGTTIALGVVLEEVGRSGLAIPLLATSTAVAVSQHSRLLDRCRTSPLADASAIVALVPSGPGESPAVGDRRGRSVRVHGGPWIVEWAQAAAVLVARVAGQDGPAAIVVPRDAPGVQVVPGLAIDNERVSEVRFDGVEVDAVDVEPLAEPDVRQLEGLVTLLRSSQLVGTALRMMELGVRHVGDRRQFGVPLGSFQAVQHLLADAATELEVARLATMEGLTEASHGSPCARSAAVARWFTTRAVATVATTVAQVHGGVGVITEYPLHQFFRRAAAAQAREGPAAAQLEDVARELLDASREPSLSS